MTATAEVQSGLEGVVAFATEIAEPDRAGGALRYRGVDIEELVGNVPFEHVWGLLVDGKLLPGLPPAEPHPLSVRSGDPRVDVQSALAMLAPQWGFGELIDISDEEARDNLARASVMALSFVAQSARGIGRPPVPQREIDKAKSIPERFLIRWRGEADPRHVEAFIPCSAAEIQYASIASTWRGSASPRQRITKRSGIDFALSTSRWDTGGLPIPRADWATNESAITDARARLSRASSSEMSISCPKPHCGASIASADCTSTRGSPERTVSECGSAGGNPGRSSPSTSRPQTCSNGTLPTSSSMSTPR